MRSAKDLIVKPVRASIGNQKCIDLHYSGKYVRNSQIHFGVFLDGKLEGVMQFGPPINKKGSISIVDGTKWDGMLELNRMAFSDVLPRNSESRAMAVAFRVIKKRYPQIEWVLSFSDATQCGDGAIYRASGFVLTDIRKSRALRRNPATGEVMHDIQAHHLMIQKDFRTWPLVEGFQLRYIKFLSSSARNRLAVPVLPFSDIDKLGARMYRGSKPSVGSVESDTPAIQAGEDGATPISTLQTKEAHG